MILRCVRFITSLTIFRGTVDVNWNNLEKCKIGVLLSDCKLKLVFLMPSEMSILGIMVRNAELMALLSIYKGNANMN